MEKMELSEARRRFEKLLVLSGYSMTGLWAEKPYEEEKIYVSSMALTNMPDTRGVLWFENGDWQGMIAVAVGENGEFPLTGDRIRRASPSSVFIPQKLLSKRIDEIRDQVRRWDKEWAAPLADKAMMKLALNYLRDNKPRKAARVLLMALRGDISVATISESLSIVQMTLARSREERLRSALIWGQVFK